MTTSGAAILDRYNREARLAPALLIVLPLVLIVHAWLPQHWIAASSFAAVISALGGTLWLVQLSRDRGKRLELDLFSKWGGKPSTRFLRHNDNSIDANTKARYHSALTRSITGLRMPSETDERSDADRADSVYQSAVDWLLVRTRDRKAFPLVFEENVGYGFRRNLYAMRPIALGAGGAAFLIGSVDLALAIYLGGPFHPWQFAAIGATGVYVLLFFFLVSESWVQVAAENYAKQLLAACDAQDLNVHPPTVVQTPPQRKRA